MASSILVQLLCLVAILAMAQGRHFAQTQMSIKDENVLNGLDQTFYGDCHALHKAGYNISGVYKINVNKTELLVPCEFRDGVGHTIFLQRVDSSLSFMQPWGPYESGFGHPSGNFWLGLAHIYALALRGAQLQIQLFDWSGRNFLLHYNTFSLGPRDQRYRLYVSGYYGGLIDDLSYHNGMPFSTFDATDPAYCAQNMKAGWWYNNCAYALLTGHIYQNGYYHPGKFYDGMFWKDWYGYNYSLKHVTMAILPRTA